MNGQIYIKSLAYFTRNSNSQAWRARQCLNLCNIIKKKCTYIKYVLPYIIIINYQNVSIAFANTMKVGLQKNSECKQFTVSLVLL
jgi:hypothetical protein